MKNAKNYYKGVNQTLTSGNGNPRNKSFRVLETKIVNGFAIETLSEVDFYDNEMNFICTKRKSGKYFNGTVSGKEINKSTFEKWDKKLSKIKSENQLKNQIKRFKKRSKNAVKILLLSFKKENDILIARQIAESRKEEILPLIEELKESNDRQEWHQKANRIVGLIGYEFCKTIGWKQALNIAKEL